VQIAQILGLFLGDQTLIHLIQILSGSRCGSPFHVAPVDCSQPFHGHLQLRFKSFDPGSHLRILCSRALGGVAILIQPDYAILHREQSTCHFLEFCCYDFAFGPQRILGNLLLLLFRQHIFLSLGWEQAGELGFEAPTSCRLPENLRCPVIRFFTALL